MMDNLNDEKQFVVFKVENSMFAIPVSHTLCVMPGKSSMSFAALPNQSEGAECMVELDGQIVPVVHMPGACRDFSVLDNFIVVLENCGQKIGIIVDDAHLTSILTSEIQEDMTGSKSFTQGGKIYFLLDISQFFKDLGIHGGF